MEENSINTNETDKDAKIDVKESAERPSDGVGKPGFFKALVWIGALAALVAWAVFFFDGFAAMIIAAVGAVASAAGIAVGRGCLRDIAITSLVASVVLLVVFAAFYWGIPYALGV